MTQFWKQGLTKVVFSRGELLNLDFKELLNPTYTTTVEYAEDSVGGFRGSLSPISLVEVGKMWQVARGG